jgi:hypothetical protein
LDAQAQAQGAVNAYAMRTFDTGSRGHSDGAVNDPAGALDALWASRWPVAPAVVTSRAAAAMIAASEDMLRGLEALLAISGARSLLQRMSGYPSALENTLAATFGVDPFLLARTDVILQGESVTVMEVNVTSRLGFLFEHDVMIEELERFSDFSATVAGRGLRSLSVSVPLVRFLRQALAERGGGGVVFIAVGTPSALRPDHHLPGLIRHELARYGLAAFVGQVGDLASRGSEIVHPEAGPVRLIYRLFSPVDLANSAVCQAVMDGVAACSLTVIDGFIGESFATKLPLALLSDAYWLDQLPSDLARRLRGCVPWTRLLADRGTGTSTDPGEKEVDVVAYTLAHRETLVLKPGMGSGGVWVVIGREISQRQWETAIASALRSGSPWVVQEFAEPTLVPVLSRDEAGLITQRDRVANYSVILVGGKAAGLIRKEADTAGARVLNRLQGARIVPLYIEG